MDRIRNLQGNGKFIVHDDFVDRYGKICGVIASAVYAVLCRHAGKDQTCFPSKKTISEKLGVSERSVYTALKKLEHLNMIKIGYRKVAGTSLYKNHLYTLLDRTVWRKVSEEMVATGKKQQLSAVNDSNSQRHPLPAKETQEEGNTNKDSAETSSAEPFSLIEELEKMDDNPRREINVISWFISEKKVCLENKQQLNSTIKRYIKVAKEVADFSDEQLRNILPKVKRDMEDKWTLETIFKYLTK